MTMSWMYDNTVEMLNKRENYAKSLRKASKETLLNKKRRKFISTEGLELKEEANRIIQAYYPNLAHTLNSTVTVFYSRVEGKVTESCCSIIHSNCE
jgi:hypothetical protein